MSARLYRIQGDATDGVLRSITILDEVVAQDPITDAIIGTGNLLPATVITEQEHPDLFTLLNAVAAKVPERVQTQRAKLAEARREAAAAAAETIVIESTPDRVKG